MWLESPGHAKQLPKGNTYSSEKSGRASPCPPDPTGTPPGSRRAEFGCREFGGPVPVQLFPEVVHNLP